MRNEIAAMSVGLSVNAIAAKPAASRTEAEQKQLRWYFLEHAAAPEIRESRKRFLQLESEREVLERSFPTVMVMAESPTPKDTFLLIRGAYDKHGEKVTPGLPEVLDPLQRAAYRTIGWDLPSGSSILTIR